MPRDDSELGEVFDFDAVDEMESSEDEDGPMPRELKSGPSKAANPTAGESMSRGIHRNKGPIEKSTWGPLSKQGKLGMDSGMRVAMATDGMKVLVDNQQEPATTEERKAITRVAQKIRDRLEKKRVVMDGLANAQSTGKRHLL